MIEKFETFRDNRKNFSNYLNAKKQRKVLMAIIISTPFPTKL